ncbi:DUF5677 domain-containing protein [Caulobacter sp. 602-1]|uniref:DUF5677 domain-containing protein n=1 Tax=Caulobacter sp. 602-1 TaxID=2492472 RepID=UPI000F641A99|nr:DUF5677 domain-containing protein [Caulobacter sp. 602-1]RRN64293.1 hypothetical protein EIK80_09520 [Caulobacter sp. 602-1]
MAANDPYTALEAALGDIAAIGNSLGDASTNIRVTGDDPKFLSLALFWRACNHFQAFTMLWKAKLYIDAEIIVRSSIETAICLANLNARRMDFMNDLIADLSHTMGGQMKMLRRGQFDFTDEVAAQWAEELASKGARMDLETLAKGGHVDNLYAFHRLLSAFAVHITGMSVGRHCPFGDDDDGWSKTLEATKEADRRRSVLWMLTAMTATLLAHAEIIDDKVHMDRMTALLEKLKPVIEAFADGQSPKAGGGL